MATPEPTQANGESGELQPKFSGVPFWVDPWCCYLQWVNTPTQLTVKLFSKNFNTHSQTMINLP